MASKKFNFFENYVKNMIWRYVHKFTILDLLLNMRKWDWPKHFFLLDDTNFDQNQSSGCWDINAQRPLGPGRAGSLRILIKGVKTNIFCYYEHIPKLFIFEISNIYFVFLCIHQQKALLWARWRFGSLCSLITFFYKNVKFRRKYISTGFYLKFRITCC